ncbi:MAG: polysaccharide deacetylase family protein, partial [Solirubrobacteraceae bacterium]
FVVAMAVIAVSSASAAGIRAGRSRAVTSPAAGHAMPPPIRSATLRQVGLSLVWRVRLGERFPSLGLLKRRHQSLCLLLEWAGSGAVRVELCAVSTRRGPALLRSVRSRRFYHVAATVTRPDAITVRAAFPPKIAHTSYHSTLRWQTETAVLRPACVPPPTGADPCVQRFPHRPARLRLHVPRLVGCHATGPKWVFNGPSRGRMVALTFDDGPWYDTPQFLGVLERNHVVATFFQIGDQISEYGEHGALERRMLRDGDMIGDHTWSHPDVAGDGSFAAYQIRSAADAIRHATRGFYPCLFRAPYGDVSTALLNEARRMGFTTIQWDVDPRDWSLPGTSAIYDNVVANAHPGAIVIQHDGGGPRYETLDALPREIHTLRARGYRFVTVTQLLGYKLIYK